MAKGESSGGSALLHELTSVEIYKRSQGRIARQVTFGVLVAVLAIGLWSLRNTLLADVMSVGAQFATCVVLLAFGAWVSYRFMNLPKFADFLIAVEAEMNKVSWPSRRELTRSAVVVMVTMFGLAAVLYGYDLLWQWLLTALDVLQGGSAQSPGG